MRYSNEILDGYDDDGTMPKCREDLEEVVVGHKIVSVEKNALLPGYDEKEWWRSQRGTAITLDNGKRVFLIEQGDCCAYTDLKTFLLHPEMVDHIITGVGTTDSYQTWHIYADMGDVLELTVSWSAGNVGYYGYGFEIQVFDPEQ